MFDVLIREAGARFGLGEKALPVAQMLLAAMTNRDTGGLAGFLEQFKAAGLGPIVQSWLGGGPSAQPVSNSQLESVLGVGGGLLSVITERLGVNRDNVTSAIGYLLPAFVGKLTPGGSLPSSLPPEVESMAAAGHSLLAAPAVATAAQPAGGGGVMKWLPWAVVAAAAVFGLSYCNKERSTTEPPATPATAPVEPASVPAEVASEPADVAPEPSEAPAEPASEAAPVAAFGGTAPSTPASAPDTSASEPEAPAADFSPGAAASVADDEPIGAAVVDLVHDNTMPALKVYFDSGQTEVHGDFAAKSADLVAYMQEHTDVTAVISGYNDPTGDAAANAELAKNRAKAVQDALVAAGIPEERTELEKPAETTGTAATNAASRRVEVVLRK